jgi:type VI secretion system protein ImpA
MPEANDLVEMAFVLAPIPGDVPVGLDLREDRAADALYTRLRDARADARTAERAQDNAEGDYVVPPEWRTIRDLATEALTQHSKDLEIAGWLTEALLRSDGLRGLVAGLEVMRGLVDQYWENLYPLADEDGIETRVAPLTALNGQSGDGALVQPLRRIKLFTRPDGEPLQFWQYEQSVDMAGIAEEARRKQRIAAGVIPFDTLETEARLPGGAGLVEVARDAAAASESWAALSASLDAHAGADAPPATRIREVLEQIHAAAARFAGPGAMEAAAVAEQPVEAQPEAAPGATSDSVPVVPGAIASRADALRSLTAIAAYFRRTEPLSPLAYTLEEVVRRASMTWPQLLEEIVPDAGARASILNTLGIRPPTG